MTYIFIFIFLFISIAIGCEVTLPEQLVVVEENPAGRPAYPTNCPDKTIDDLHQTLIQLHGRAAAYQLQEIMSQKGHQVTISPAMIQVQQLKTLLREQLNLPPGVHVKSTLSNNTSHVMTLEAGDRIEVNCTSCLFGNRQVINVDIHNFDGQKKSFMAYADFKKMIKAYRLNTSVQAFTEISSNILKEEFIESIPHTDLITEADELRFYKTNKPLKGGELLRRSDLNAMSIVRAGMKTEVILENSLVKIKTQGISRGNGSIGEWVEVFQPQKNKKYQGKVIDINKVFVEL